MKNVYIDLGAYRGLYINRFRKSCMYKPDFQIFAFECNPHLQNVNYGMDVTTIRKAAWIHDGELDFFISRKTPERVQGSSVYKEKRTGNLDKEHPTKIPCIDFSKWIKDNFSPDDNIILKMNIEGAEYDILEKCLVDGTVSYIKTAWIQWHWQRCGIPEERHRNLVKKLNEYPIIQHRGYGDFK